MGQNQCIALIDIQPLSQFGGGHIDDFWNAVESAVSVDGVE